MKIDILGFLIVFYIILFIVIFRIFRSIIVRFLFLIMLFVQIVLHIQIIMGYHIVGDCINPPQEIYLKCMDSDLGYKVFVTIGLPVMFLLILVVCVILKFVMREYSLKTKPNLKS